MGRLMQREFGLLLRIPVLLGLVVVLPVLMIVLLTGIFTRGDVRDAQFPWSDGITSHSMLASRQHQIR